MQTVSLYETGSMYVAHGTDAKIMHTITGYTLYADSVDEHKWCAVPCLCLDGTIKELQDTGYAVNVYIYSSGDYGYKLRTN